MKGKAFIESNRTIKASQTEVNQTEANQIKVNQIEVNQIEVNQTKVNQTIHINRNEVLRYLGYRNPRTSKPDEQTEALIDSCIEEVQRTAEPKSVYRVYPLYREESENRIDGGCFVTRSENLCKNLRDCEQILVFAATLGVGIDRLLTRYGKLAVSRAIVMQAVTASAIEGYCNELNEGWKRTFANEGWYLRPRFSPGYGDFSLENQKAIIQALEAGKWTGITLTDSLLMMPSKSVTAVIGMSRTAGHCVLEGCEVCEKLDCMYRRDTR